MLTLSSSIDKDDIATNAASQQQWINISIFSAKLAATKVPQLNELSRGGYVLRTLLENTPEDINELRGTVPAAAVWINLNGKTIYESKGKMEGEYDWITSEWKGEKGWSKERWTFWKERFATISTEEALDKETREIAKNAAELMGKIEAEN